MARLNDNLFTNRAIGFMVLTRFGLAKVRFTERGLAELAYVEGDAADGTGWNPELDRAFKEWVGLFDGADLETRWDLLDLEGSDFRRSVWRALLAVPYAQRIRYGEIASRIGHPGATRAVGSAVGANPVAVVVPCHRVLPKAGGLGNYRWGVARKRALLDAEEESGSARSSLF